MSNKYIYDEEIAISINLIPDLETEFVPTERKPISSNTKKTLLIILSIIISLIIIIPIRININ